MRMLWGAGRGCGLRQQPFRVWGLLELVLKQSHSLIQGIWAVNTDHRLVGSLTQAGVGVWPSESSFDSLISGKGGAPSVRAGRVGHTPPDSDGLLVLL